jgi:hypothetical protein
MREPDGTIARGADSSEKTALNVLGYDAGWKQSQ